MSVNSGNVWDIQPRKAVVGVKKKRLNDTEYQMTDVVVTQEGNTVVPTRSGNVKVTLGGKRVPLDYVGFTDQQRFVGLLDKFVHVEVASSYGATRSLVEGHCGVCCYCVDHGHEKGTPFSHIAGRLTGKLASSQEIPLGTVGYDLSGNLYNKSGAVFAKYESKISYV